MNPRLLTLLCALALPAFAAAPARLNFLWLIAEDTGPSAYSCYGEQPAAHTPNIDRLEIGRAHV